MSRKTSITTTTTQSSYSDRPIKSILKKSFNRTTGNLRSLKFDEENVRSTFHPIDKDYGHDIVDEPDTPYPTRHQQLDTNLLSEKLVQLKAEETENEEQEEKHKEFLRKRAEIYKSEFRPSQEDVNSPKDDEESDKHKKFRNKRYLMASTEYKTAKKFGQNIDKDENNE